MEVVQRQEGGRTVLYLMGELDNNNAEYARNRLDEALEDRRGAVVLDFKLLSFMDSTGIGVLIGRYKKVSGRCQLYVRNANKTIDKILVMSGLYEILPKAN